MKNKKVVITVIILSLLTLCLFIDMVNHKNNDINKEKEIIITEDKSKEIKEIPTVKIRTTTTMYVSAQNGLNIREFASEDSKIIDIVKVNTELEIYDDFNLNGWRMIKWGNNDYYVYGDYLSENRVRIITPNSKPLYSTTEFKKIGVIYWNNYKWTWYSQNVLSGGGLDIPNRHVDKNGYVCDGDGYICLASSTLSKGSIIETPFGKNGKVYDSGCAVGTIDVYTNF